MMILRIATCPALFPASLYPGFAGALEVIVGHKPKTISEMVRTRARGFDRDAPHGVTHGFQITSHAAEPFNRVRNLLSKNDCRRSLRDEPEKFWPKVSLVGKALLRARDGERLAWAGAGPNGSAVLPSGEPESAAPPSESGEEMALRVSGKVAGLYVNDTSLVNVAGRDVSGGDEVSEPLSGEGVDFIVISSHLYVVGVSVCVLEADKHDLFHLHSPPLPALALDCARRIRYPANSRDRP